MRLQESEITHITNVFSSFVKTKNVQLYLYGSRTDDQKKGGDIDLLLVTSDPDVSTYLQSSKLKILLNLKELIGDQKIDLRIAHKKELTEDPFLKVIFPQAILLKTW
jgi:uncharacterized protein